MRILLHQGLVLPWNCKNQIWDPQILAAFLFIKPFNKNTKNQKYLIHLDLFILDSKNKRLKKKLTAWSMKKTL